MEAVGAVASIIGIVGAGAKLSIALFDFATTIGSAGAEVRAIGTEISLFCSVLKQLEKTLAKAKNRRYSISAIEATQEILHVTRGVFDSIEGIINGLQKHKGRSMENSIDLTARINWTLRKRSRIQKHRAELESHKITLHIMLTTLDFARKLSSRRISTVETDLEDEQEEMMTQSLVHAHRVAVDNLERAETIEEASDSTEKEDGVEDSDKPPPYVKAKAVARAEDSGRRKSVWLRELLSDSTLDPNTRRLSAESTGSKIHQLPQFLWKWTDQGKHWNDMHGLSSAATAYPETPANTQFQEPKERICRYETFPLSPSSTEAPTPRDQQSQSIQLEYFPLSQAPLNTPKRATRKVPPPPLPLSLKRAEPPTPSLNSLPSPSPSPMNATFHAEVLRSPRPSPSLSRFPRSPTVPTASVDPRATGGLNTLPAYKNINMRIERGKTCESILPDIMRRYGLEEDPVEYCLFLKTDDWVRRLEDKEMPLKLLKLYKDEGRHPEFQLKKVDRYSIPTDTKAWV